MTTASTTVARFTDASASPAFFASPFDVSLLMA
jgi:hypothetical protein